jgi:hypothetical protein
MLGKKSSFKAFGEGSLSDVLRRQTLAARKKVLDTDDNTILNVSETSIVETTAAQFLIEPPLLDFDNITRSDPIEVDVPTKWLPTYFDRRPGQTVRKPAVYFFIPFSGEIDVIRYTPNVFSAVAPEVFIEGGSLLGFEVVLLDETPEELKREKDEMISRLKSNLKGIQRDVKQFNETLGQEIESVFQSRKQQLLNRYSLVSSIDVPIRKTGNVPSTFSVTTTRKKATFQPLPPAKDKNYVPEPVLPDGTYGEILQVINEMGKVFERYPQTFEALGEEDLRNHIILTLTPQFGIEGSVTGETFNKSGKTDILIRYKNSNLFVAECKFWNGPASFLDTLTQLFRYLTWRDSKAAAIVFVRNKDFSDVLQAVASNAPSHPNYVSFVNKGSDTWFNYRFHVNDDANREVKLAVLLFHIPSKSREPDMKE